MRIARWGNALELIVPVPVAEEMMRMDEFASLTRKGWDGWQRSTGNNHKERPEYYAEFSEFTEDQLRTISGLCHKHGEKKMEKTVQAIINYDRAIPGYDPAFNVMMRWLENHCPSGWVYVEGRDGVAWPYLITDVRARVPDHRDREERPSFTVTAVASTLQGRNTSIRMQLEPRDVTRKKVATIMDNHGWMIETPELKAAYEEAHAYAKSILEGRMGEQFRLDRGNGAVGRKVILDTHVASYSSRLKTYETYLCAGKAGDYQGDIRPVPVHPLVDVFTLDIHDMETVNASRLQPYQYDPEMVNKLILPESHMDILDVLTTDLELFMSDIVEGKKAGNIILCKGIPGIGKTLTAEVYGEVVQRPIYNVHSGALGTNPHEVEKSLRTIFERVLRWDCILLLDEADVFVGVRGNDLVQNAIVSVFLRLLEYFGGLMFMTTNRSDNIDDALISRCAAIIDYGLPSRDDMYHVWRVMGEQQGVTLPDSLIQALLYTFPSAAPRDAKHLLRLALRVSHTQGTELDEAVFRKVGQFRAVEIAPPALMEHIKPAKPGKRARARPRP